MRALKSTAVRQPDEYGVDHMLDKSVPYAGLYMHRKAGLPIPEFSLPEGYRFSFFSDGDEAGWARIEASVLEFDSRFAALLHFKEKFMPFADELYRRCVFIETMHGEKIATATAWWTWVEGSRRPWLYWVGADPRYQRLGLGKALVSKALSVMAELEGDVDFYLHTQTWSYKAIGIYKAHGFQPTDEKALYKERRDNYKRAMRILKRLERR